MFAALSMPRLCFSDPMMLMMQLTAMNIEVRKQSGPFWEQSLSKHLYKAVEEGWDFVLTADYDSVFKPVDVYYMLDLMVKAPEVAAVFPIQYRREADQIIIGVTDQVDGKATGDIFKEHLAPATIGHFGLTILRVSALKDLPHPWFLSQPGSDGRWDAPDAVDADVYFWKKLRAHGKEFRCASRCLIGHIQQTITWPGEDYQPVHQYIGDYFKDGDAPKVVLDGARVRAGFPPKGSE